MSPGGVHKINHRLGGEEISSRIVVHGCCWRHRTTADMLTLSEVSLLLYTQGDFFKASSMYILYYYILTSFR